MLQAQPHTIITASVIIIASRAPFLLLRPNNSKPIKAANAMNPNPKLLLNIRKSPFSRLWLYLTLFTLHPKFHQFLLLLCTNHILLLVIKQLMEVIFVRYDVILTTLFYLLKPEHPQTIITASIIKTAKRVPLRLPNISKKNAIKAANDATGKKLLLLLLQQ